METVNSTPRTGGGAGSRMTSTQEEIFRCVLCGDVDGVADLLQRQEEPRQQDALRLKDELGRTALLAAAMLGRSAIIRELRTHGAELQESTARGYSALHLAACWGHLDTVRTLLDLGADTGARTCRGARPVDLARKYSKTDCAEYLMLAEAQQDLTSYVASVRDLAADPQKNLTKEEKNICTRACSAKSDWIQSAQNPTVSDFLAQRKDIEDTLQPILSKLSAPGKN